MRLNLPRGVKQAALAFRDDGIALFHGVMDDIRGQPRAIHRAVDRQLQSLNGIFQLRRHAAFADGFALQIADADGHVIRAVIADGRANRQQRVHGVFSQHCPNAGMVNRQADGQA